MSVQTGEVASQKFTVPSVTATPFDVTVAVRATAVPRPTDVTGFPPEVTARVVKVDAAEGSIYVADVTADCV